jgi:tetratricopeptide (TPR) repeat protein
MRIAITIFFLFLLSACHARTADQAYKEGKYLESISLLTASIDEKGQAKFDKGRAEKLRTIVSNVMAHYEADLAHTANTDYQHRINAYQSLLKMKMMLSDRFYSQTVSFFNDKYDIKKLEETIAKQYYDYGNSITGTDSESYRKRADLYQKGFEQYNYKNIENLYKNAKTKYMQLAAKDYYNQGKMLEQQGNYKAAAEAFNNASEVYQPLGKYKDSGKLAVDNDRKHCAQEAEKYYQQAQQLANTATHRYEFREVAKYYAWAASAYRQYGAYRDATFQSDKYTNKGIVRIYYNSTELRSYVRDILRKDFIQFVIYNPSEADVIMRIKSNVEFSDLGQSVNNQTRTEKVFDKFIEMVDDNGNKNQVKTYKDQQYNLQTVTHSNKLTLTTEIEAHGAYSYSRSFNIEQTSARYDYIYSGNVPSKLRNYSEGSLQTRERLLELAQKQQLKEVKLRLEDILRDLSYL